MTANLETSSQLQDLIGNPAGPHPDREYSLGMPQMMFGGLSERWLLKESGDMHWRLVCLDLKRPSAELMDTSNERLYASFLRVRIESTCHFQCFRENDRLALETALSRFGDKRFYSTLSYRSAGQEIRCNMNTVFTSREADNKSLARSKPRALDQSTCYVHGVVPLLGQGYHAVKEVALMGGRPPAGPLLALSGVEFSWSDEEIFTTEYRINPYYDLNGVNLLYFASYPRIHDVCERVWALDQAASRGISQEWALGAAALARDVFYYGNADIEDTIIFRLYGCEFLAGYIVKFHSALFRKQDGARIADIFTLKQLADPSSEYAVLWNQ